MKKSFNFILHFFPIALIITLFSGLVFSAVQQNFRQSANDPQIQIAEDMAGLLSGGFPASSLISTGLPIELSTSLGTYAMVFDDSGKILISSAKLHGKDPTLPSGIFELAKENKEHRLTWQPESDIRSALVIVHYSGTVSGYVAVGRSLKEVEKRINQLENQTMVVWFSSLLIAGIASYLLWRKGTRLL